MRQAKSIFLAGELIDATEANHSDYYNKGTICPFCLEKVYYSNPFTRESDGKIISVSASFKHHKGDPLDCEARAKSAEGKKLLATMTELFSPESREQRKPIWDKYLWEIFKEGMINYHDGDYQPRRLDFNPLRLPISQPIPGKRLKFLTRTLAEIWGFVWTNTYNIETNQEAHWDTIVAPFKTEIFQNITEGGVSIITPPSIHFQITFEVMKSLFNRKDEHHLLSRFALVVLDEMEDKEMRYFVEASNRLIYRVKHNIETNLTNDEFRAFSSTFMSFFTTMLCIDWHELSKKPWKQLVKKNRNTTVSLKGMGFGS